MVSPGSPSGRGNGGRAPNQKSAQPSAREMAFDDLRKDKKIGTREKISRKWKGRLVLFKRITQSRWEKGA